MAQTIVEYTYDLFDRKIARAETDVAGGTTDVEYYAHDGQHIAVRLDSDGQVQNRYLHGPLVDMVLADEQVTTAGAAGDVLWTLADNLGTIRDLASHDAATGTTTIANHRVFDAFGNVTSETNAAVDHLFGMTGRDFDEITDLRYHRARWFDANLGQWLSEDPIGFAAGDENLRRYVGNGTTNATDPSGLVYHGIYNPDGPLAEIEARPAATSKQEPPSPYASQPRTGGLKGPFSVELIDELVAQGIAHTAFDGRYVVITDVAGGQILSLVLRRTEGLRGMVGPRHDPVYVDIPPCFRVVGREPHPLPGDPALLMSTLGRLRSPDHAADLISLAVARSHADAMQRTAGRLEFVLHMLPTGAAIDHARQGNTTEAVVAALGDLALVLGPLARTVNLSRLGRFGIGAARGVSLSSTALRGELILQGASVGFEGSLAFYRIGQGVYALRNEDSGACAYFGEAFLRLAGVSASSVALLRNASGLQLRAPTRTLADQYADAVRSNRPWSWAEHIEGGADLTAAQRRAIKQEAIQKGLIPDVPTKAGTRYPDFEAAGLIERVDSLPEHLWKSGDTAQFNWLDARIPGGRPAGMTWHHSEIPGRMELVPFGPHNIINHPGGRSPGMWANAPR